jgi:tRNA (cmo5U34)-methyltransferase
LDGLADAARAAVYDDYIDAVADLHMVDPDSLDLPSFRRPVDGPSHATCELDLWGGILASRTARPWPLAHYALALLRRWAPSEVSRTVVCHGDVGPGNFVHDGRRVTALLDWEFCHVGDPMDDLGWWVFRGHDMAGGCGDLAAQLQRWSARTGLPVDPWTVDYYRTFVMLRWLISISAPLDAGTSAMDRSVYFGLLPVLSVRIPAALAALAGIDLGPPPEMPDDPAPGPAEPVLEAMRGDLIDVIAPDLRSPDARRRAGAAMLYLAHLSALDRLGPALAAADDDDLAEVLGRRPGRGPAREHDLAAAVADGEPSAEVLGYFWRHGLRQAALWPPVASRALGVPTPVPDLSTGRADQFHFHPATYLDMVRAEVPAYDELEAAVAAATAGRRADRVLDLGVGTGETSRRVLEVHPDAAVVGLDESAEMLVAAGAHLPTADLRVGRLEDPLPEGEFDLVVSALAVHHLDGAGKADLFGRVAGRLRAGGRFVLGDVVVPDDPADVVTPIDGAYDMPSSVEDQLRWLAAAGLDAHVVWTRRDLAVIVAEAPGSG